MFLFSSLLFSSLPSPLLFPLLFSSLSSLLSPLLQAADRVTTEGRAALTAAASASEVNGAAVAAMGRLNTLGDLAREDDDVGGHGKLPAPGASRGSPSCVLHACPLLSIHMPPPCVVLDHPTLRARAQNACVLSVFCVVSARRPQVHGALVDMLCLHFARVAESTQLCAKQALVAVTAASHVCALLDVLQDTARLAAEVTREGGHALPRTLARFLGAF